MEDLAAFDESLAEKIQKLPTEYLPILEEAAKDVADELTTPRPEGEEKVEDIQVLLCSDAHPSSLRGMKVKLYIIQYGTVKSIIFCYKFRQGINYIYIYINDIY